MYDNNFDGSLPPTLGSGMKALTNLAIDHCELGGTIPESLGSAISLYSVVLGENQLVGTVPASLAGLKRLEVLSLESNQLSGVPPPLHWQEYDAMCDMTGNNFTCPCKDQASCRSDANWMSAHKHCNATCHYA